MRKNILLLIILFLFSTSLVLAEVNFSFTNRRNLQFDESLSSNIEANYHRPQQILVFHIEPTHNYLLNDTPTWMRLFHYYIVTRYEYPDMPFNYVIDSSGNIYEAIEDSEGRASYIEGEQGSVTVAYLSETSTFSPSAQRGFRELIEGYSYKYAIRKDRVKPVELIISENSSLPSYESSEGVFQESFLSMIEDFEYSETMNLRFSGEVKDIQHQKNIESGERLEISFILKNTDNFSWYIDEGFVFLSTIDGEESPFAINQVWDSFSKPFALESQTVFPGEEMELSFELETESILPGNYELGFKFVMLPDIDILGSEFIVNFEIDRGERKVVQIRRTNTGELTVYSCPSYTCTLVAGAISGEKYLVLDEEESWYKISVDGVEGWVTMHYATPVD